MNLLFAALWIYLLVKLAPHLGAVVGIESGNRSYPAFAVTTLAGRPLTADSLRGKVVLVNFWATWCLPCRVEMPLLDAMARRHRDAGLVVLGFSVDQEGPAAVRRFLAERDIGYPVAIVGPAEIRAFGGVVGYPTSILLDRSGRIRHQALGPLAMASFEPAVRRLLAEPSPALPARSAPAP
ncbi:MAG: TlpA family protein disulfide reductase [Gemmatimonadales bacterium]